MVNISPIPPLLCSTPPPIDFDDDDGEYMATPPVLNDADETEEDVNELRESVIEADLPPIDLYKHAMISNNAYMPQYTPPPLDDVENKYPVTQLNVEAIDLTSSTVSQLDQNTTTENLSSDFSNSTASIPNIELIKTELEKTSMDIVAKKSIESNRIFQKLDMVTIEDVLEDDSETEGYVNKIHTEGLEKDVDFFEIKEIQPREISSQAENVCTEPPALVNNENSVFTNEEDDINKQNSNCEEFDELVFQQTNLESETISMESELNHDDVLTSSNSVTEATLENSLERLENDEQCETQSIELLETELPDSSHDEDSLNPHSKPNNDISISNLKANSSENSEITKSSDINDNFGNFAQAFDNKSQETYAQEAEVETNSTSTISDFAVFPTSFESNIIYSHSESNSFINSNAFQQNEEDENEDDDDFGDFNAAEPVTTTQAATTTHSATCATESNLPSRNVFCRPSSEQLTKFVELIFPFDPEEALPSSQTDASDCPVSELFANKHDGIYLNSIDTAKALEFQWSTSHSRQAFLKALGIDDRQTVCGEHWNPLSESGLNPLKPIKSQMTESISNSPSGSIGIDCQLINETTENTETEDLHLKPANTENPKDNSSTNDELYKEIATKAADTTQHLSHTLEYGEKFSKTPPLSEMDTITSFNTLPEEPMPPSLDSLPAVTSNISTLNLNDFPATSSNKNSISSDSTNDVITTSTYSGPLKETHIYTPKKLPEDVKRESPTNSSASSSSSAKVPSIDFDYEKAAMGVIIDETVVKKEYRDVVYNPDLNFNTLSKDFDAGSSKLTISDSSKDHNNLSSLPQSAEFADDDEFTDFQYVGVNTYQNANTATHVKDVQKPTSEFASAPLAANHGMILSPAILLPQAIPMSRQQKPQIEWGDDTVNINPEELARIEELYSAPKAKSSTARDHYKIEQQKQNQTHQGSRSYDSKAGDDDDWSDFVSVPVANHLNKHSSNNNNLPQGYQLDNAKKVLHEKTTLNAASVVNSNIKDFNNCSNLDDEWSDFVCSAPLANAVVNHHPLPQFNSSAWKNANFYNNPLSFYHKDGVNIHLSNAAKQTNNNINKINYNNNSSNNNNNNSNTSKQIKSVPQHYHKRKQQQHMPVQQIHIMQNFSTAPVAQPERLPATVRSNQFLVGSAKVAPSIALIPDLGFVAPAISTHTSFINSLPKPNSLNMKK